MTPRSLTAGVIMWDSLAQIPLDSLADLLAGLSPVRSPAPVHISKDITAGGTDIAIVVTDHQLRPGQAQRIFEEWAADERLDNGDVFRVVVES